MTNEQNRCPHCGNEMEREAVKGAGNRFCSRECAADYYRGKISHKQNLEYSE